MRLFEAIIAANHRALAGDAGAGLHPSEFEDELPVVALTCIDARLNPLDAATASLNRSLTAPPVRNLRDGRPGHRYSGNESPNIGRPLLDCS